MNFKNQLNGSQNDVEYQALSPEEYEKAIGERVEKASDGQLALLIMRSIYRDFN